MARIVQVLNLSRAPLRIGTTNIPVAKDNPGWIFLAPALLVLLRFAQGLALGGEWSGAALVATENAPAGKRAVYGTFPQLGAPIGFILANGLFLIIAAVTSLAIPAVAGSVIDEGYDGPVCTVTGTS